VTPIDVASIYDSLEEVDWNIMIPVSIHETQSHNATVSFQEQEELTPHPESMDTGFAEYIKTLPDHIQ
jgi:hypothetical protein